jgi:PKD repeat protein
MPGLGNTPQAMLFEPTNHPAAGVATPVNWFRAEGIPLSPYDDAHRKNPYPLMRLIARNAANQPVATNDIVLPVSDEMDCRACHASGAQAAATPAAGWVWDGLPERDFRLNILRLHDEKQFASTAALYAAALTARGFNPQGLYRGVVADAKPVLCAACHASEALGAPSYGTIPPLTASVHSFHAHVQDPVLNTTLDNSANRAACYRCHPGSTTRCLRGAMGGAIAADGSMEMQCQSCHGNTSQVGSTSRVGWFMEPNCQSCHSGTATSNAGQIRFTSAFTHTNWTVRVPANKTFATQADIPAPGISLYRFSAGHGGLQCSACHGSTHAEFPSIHRNDNLRNTAIQGHAGVMVECTACHVSMSVNSTNAAGGPHGMHPIGQSWVSGHHDYIQGNLAKCQACHGTDNRGTVLSRVQTTRTLTANFDGGTVTLNLFRGALIGCYSCHNGPSNDSINTNAPPGVANVSTNTTNDKAVTMTLSTGTVPLRIISQPVNGSVGLSGNTATYFPNPGFIGADTFTFAAYDGSKNSNLGTGTVSVVQGPYSIRATALVPPSYPAGWSAPFGVVATVTNQAASPSFEWDFGDGSAHSTNQLASHSFATVGIYTWTVISRASSASATNSGLITISEPMRLLTAASGSALTLSWPYNLADVIIEQTPVLSPSAIWTPATNIMSSGNGVVSVVPVPAGNQFFRLRQVR